MATRYVLLAATCACLIAAPATAATYTVALTGDTTNVGTSDNEGFGLHFHNVYFPLAGLDSSNSITVREGDTINSTTTFNNLLTIPASTVRTDILQFFTGSAFPSEDTGVTGTFTFFNGTAPVKTLGYGSTTSNQLSSFQVLFPPNNAAFSFTSFTNNFVINSLARPATLDGSAFTYSIASVPEPAAWMMMIAGFGIAGAAMRRQKVRKLSLSYA